MSCGGKSGPLGQEAHTCITGCNKYVVSTLYLSLHLQVTVLGSSLGNITYSTTPFLNPFFADAAEPIRALVHHRVRTVLLPTLICHPVSVHQAPLT